MNQYIIIEKSKTYQTKMNSENSLSLEEKLFNFIEKLEVDNIKNILMQTNIKFWEFLDHEDSTILIKLAYANLEIIFHFIQVLKDNLNHKQLQIYINKKAQNGFTALHYASFRGNIKLCEKLIEYSADIDAVNNNGLNVIHMAAQGDQPASLVLFKEKYNMNLNINDNVLSSAVHWAAYMGSDVSLDYLVNWELSVNKKDKDGFTPLHLAVMTGNKLRLKIDKIF